MPSKPPSPCLHPGCRILVADGAYCATHLASRRLASSRSRVPIRTTADSLPEESSLADKIRSSVHWKKARAVVCARHPLCCDPFGRHGDTRPALTQHVHHIEPLGKRTDLAFTEMNLAPICTGCHRAIEALERAGKPTADRFAAFVASLGDGETHDSARGAEQPAWGIL